MISATATVRRIWPVYVAAPVMLTGIQVVLPALPLMQVELGLDDAQIALVTSLYLLPSVAAAVPAGLLADRFGRRRVLAASLLLFGSGGVFLTFFHESFLTLLIVRAIQGAASAAVLSLTITMIGDTAGGPDQVMAQGFRSVLMKVGDAIFPILGGLLAGITWWAPFTAQIITIPVALLAWFSLSRFPEPRDGRVEGATRKLRSLHTDPSIIGLQASGFLRFFFKLALLTYLPVLAVSEEAMTVTSTGFVLAGSALAATVGAPLAGWMVRFVAPSLLIGVCLAVISTSLVAMATRPDALVIVAAAVTFGLADGVYGTLVNAAITQVVPAGLRATFVGVSAAIRNSGKFAAPTVIGLLVLAMPLRLAFALVGALAGLAIVTVAPMRAFDDLITGEAEVPGDD